MTSLQVSDFKGVNLEDDNVLKRNVLGQKPMKYYVQDAIRPNDGDKFAIVGNTKTYGEFQKEQLRPIPTQRNEIKELNTFQVNPAFLGRESVNRESIDDDSKLRFGGNVRLQKSQQHVTEKQTQRSQFIAPNVTNNDKAFIIQDNDFINGNGSVIPNFKIYGNNPVISNRMGKSTRSDRIETKSHYFN